MTNLGFDLFILAAVVGGVWKFMDLLGDVYMSDQTRARVADYIEHRWGSANYWGRKWRDR